MKASKTDTSGITICGAEWRKSSYSQGSGNCVELALERDGQVGVRDSKDLGGAVLLFQSSAFSDFLAAVNRGPFRTV